MVVSPGNAISFSTTPIDVAARRLMFRYFSVAKFGAIEMMVSRSGLVKAATRVFNSRVIS